MHWIPAILSLAAAVKAGSLIPNVDGVIGDMPSSPSPPPAPLSFSSKLKARSADTVGKLRLTENSGICETTPDVYQASGYGDIAEDQSVWFWYFAARNDPENAPLTLWFNGGAGSSSEIGLFQELGPCRIRNDSSGVDLNPWSWNTNSNIMFIDQPVGVGFSHGASSSASPSTVSTSVDAAKDIWSFLQIFLSDEKFSDLKERELAIWTESYGGHYGPVFASYFLDQNDAINAGTINGTILNMKYLGIGDGLTDPIKQYSNYMTYAASNPYYPLVNQSTIDVAQMDWSQAGGCKDLIEQCNAANGTNEVCSTAQWYCNLQILSRLAGDYNIYYVLAKNPDPYPANISDYLASIADDIGAEKDWEMLSMEVNTNFALTGDGMRSSVPILEKVIDAGVRTILYCGDADYILNYLGIEDMIGNFTTSFSDEYNTLEFSDFTVNGTSAGQYKNAGTFSYIRLYGAGHTVPAYTYGGLEVGEAAFQMFDQIMSDKPLSAT